MEHPRRIPELLALRRVSCKALNGHHQMNWGRSLLEAGTASTSPQRQGRTRNSRWQERSEAKLEGERRQGRSGGHGGCPLQLDQGAWILALGQWKQWGILLSVLRKSFHPTPPGSGQPFCYHTARQPPVLVGVYVYRE